MRGDENVKHYIGQLKITDGEHQYTWTCRFKSENPDERLDNLSRHWYENQEEEDIEVVSPGRYYFKGYEVAAQVDGWQEVPAEVYHQLTIIGEV